MPQDMKRVGTLSPPSAPAAEKRGRPQHRVQSALASRHLKPHLPTLLQVSALLLLSLGAFVTSAATMSEELPKEQVAELHEAFNKCDTDGDGKISLQELDAVMKALGKKLSEEELKMLIARVDKDGDGYISFPEFLEVVTKKMKGGSEAEMRQVFQAFDSNSDGHISVDELKQAMSKLGSPLAPQEVELMIREADLDKDGQVSYEEFMKVLSQK